MQPRLFIDCTHTIEAGYRTGVQRVVRSLCLAGLKNQNSQFEGIYPIMVNGDGVTLVSQSQLTGSRGSSQTVSSRMQNAARILAFESLSKWMTRRHRVGPQLPEPTSGDVLLLPDAYWAHESIWPWVDAQRRRGVRVAVVVHDLIPHLYPEFYGEEGAEHFRKYLRKVATTSDAILTVSETVAHDVCSELPKLVPGWNRFRQVAAFRNGAEFSKCRGRVRSAIDSCFDVDPHKAPFLMVGSIEIRKNHNYALDAMQWLWERGFDASLCILGEIGWRGEDFIQRAASHPEFGARLKVFHGVSDAELWYAYEKARGVLFTSICEGFGLPIAEALYHGKPTFVTDTPIHRETGGQLAIYCDLNEPRSMAMAIAAYDWNESPASTREQTRPNTWNESLDRILEILSGQFLGQARAAA